jgi:hypothetical protein
MNHYLNFLWEDMTMTLEAYERLLRITRIGNRDVRKA